MAKNTSEIIKFKSGFVYSLRLILKSNNLEQIEAAINQKLADTGSLFQGESLIIDAQAIEAPLNWASLIQFLKSKSFKVLGVSAQGELLHQAELLALPTLDADDLPNRQTAKAQSSSATEDEAAVEVKKQTPPSQTIDEEQAQPTMLIQRQLRSGQRIYAKNADLIVIGAVSYGAEIIADGNIHVYGPLRGRAIAGARGNPAARIFCSNLDAELVAIAGIYKLLDAQFPKELKGQGAIIELENDSLLFKSEKEFN